MDGQVVREQSVKVVGENGLGCYCPFCPTDQGVQGVYLTEVEAECAGPTDK